eukprot:gb/GEZJ01002763.1/.p1 GENE.gb/GEZJ01002763.1/~~gb/GEZJ01002763.1/.p1  ORF type:complete len:361 (+),score=27.20 gb/GEZJ01002763.1/:3029-4111(+)
MHILFNTVPRKNNVLRLRELVVQAYSLFVNYFYNGTSSLVCLTSTTHAILLFPEMLQECGPLRNISQFIVERMAGSLTDILKSTQRPEANLFHKTHTLFALQMFGGGMGSKKGKAVNELSTPWNHNLRHPNSHFSSNSESQQQETEELSGTSKTMPQTAVSRVKILGIRLRVGRPERFRQVKEYVRSSLPITAYDIELVSLDFFPSLTMSVDEASLKIECLAEFLRREREDIHKARHRCWVAANFEPEDSDDVRNCDGFEVQPFDVYYGVIDELWGGQSLVPNANAANDILQNVPTFKGQLDVWNLVRPHHRAVVHPLNWSTAQGYHSRHKKNCRGSFLYQEKHRFSGLQRPSNLLRFRA